MLFLVYAENQLWIDVLFPAFFRLCWIPVTYASQKVILGELNKAGRDEGNRQVFTSVMKSTLTPQIGILNCHPFAPFMRSSMGVTG